jgi:NAD(P)H-dependent FMN reductase
MRPPEPSKTQLISSMLNGSTRRRDLLRTAASGARAVENLRLIMGELQVATVRAQVGLSIFKDFENFSVFKQTPGQEKSVHSMLDPVIDWGGALKPLRENQAKGAG